MADLPAFETSEISGQNVTRNLSMTKDQADQLPFFHTISVADGKIRYSYNIGNGQSGQFLYIEVFEVSPL